MSNLVKSNGHFLPELPSLFDEFFSGDFFNRPFRGQNNGSSLPAVNVRETNDSYNLEVAAPGMNKNDFKVELDNNTLTISAQRETKNEESRDEFTRREFSYQSFHRSFNLPERRVEGDKISARYQDGILYVNIPKSEEAKRKPARQIQIA